MAWVPRNVKDQVVEKPNRFKIDGVSKTVEPDFGIVSETGTLINKAYLQPIEDFLDEVDSHIAEKAKIHNVGGTANALTITTGGSFALTDGNWIKFKAKSNNTGAVTLNVDAKGAESIRNPDGTVLAAGDLVAGQAYEAFYSTSTGFFVLRPSGAKITFNNYTPAKTQSIYDPSGTLTRSIPTAFSLARSGYTSANVGNYALFAAGYSGGNSAVVDAYDTSLTRTTPTVLSSPRQNPAGASVGNYALFGGGGGGAYMTVVDAYNTSLTRSIPTVLSLGRSSPGGASVGNYALFAGGITNSSGYVSSVVDAYSLSLVRSTPTSLSVGRGSIPGASVGNYALFGGGSTLYGGSSPVVDAYNTSLTRSIPTALSLGRTSPCGASVGNYALFAGGGSSTVVDAYNTSLTHSTPTSLSVGRGGIPGGASVGNYALFAGGSSAVVDAYDLSLVRTTPTSLSVARSSLGGASIGNYALFAGDSASNVVDAYRPEAQVFNLEVPIGTKYKFGAAEEAATSNTIEILTPATGYVKYVSGSL